jgi:PAS domain S-box-containing protein
MPVSAPTKTPRAAAAGTVLYLVKVPFLRNILASCLAVVLLLVLYNVIYISPTYRHMVTTLNEDDARRLATHLIRIMELETASISPKSVTDAHGNIIRRLAVDFRLDKLRLFDRQGAIVFSSEPTEIGRVDTSSYITQKVAEGETFSRHVAKETLNKEGRTVMRDLVGVYIPLMNQQRFVGAFEFHYDMTDANSRLNALLQRSNLVIGVVAVVMMTIVLAALIKAGAAMKLHSRMDKAVKDARDLLENRVRERTQELINSNKDLQLEIMERRIAEANLRESERRFRTLVDTIPYGIQELDMDGNITFANPAHAQLYGSEPSQLVGTSILDLAAGEYERQQLEEHLADIAAHHPRPYPWFSKDSTKDGGMISTQVDWNYKRDVQGRVLGLITVISDISHRKNAEKALLDNLTFMNTLIDTIPNPVFYKDNEGLYLGCNLAYAQTLGLDKEAILGSKLVELESTIASDMAEHYHRQDLLLIKNSGVQVHEEQIHCADGRRRDFVLYKATFSDAEDKVAGMVGIMLDITARKKAEKAVKEGKNLFDAFMQHLPGLAFMKDIRKRYIYVNDAFTHLTATNADDTFGRKTSDLWDAQTAAIIDNNDDKVLQSRMAENHMEDVRLTDGQLRHLLTARFPIFQDDVLFALGGISIDITARTIAQNQKQQLELQLQQTQKMEALGTLAGGIAHDFNNILAAIIGYTEIALADIHKDAAARQYLNRVLESGERARSLVKQILAFSRKGDMEPKPVQLKLIVKEVLKMLRASLPATIDIIQEIRSDGAVMADPTQLHQVIMNLGTNSGYAMGQSGGQFTVRLEEIDVDRPWPQQHGDIAPGPYLKLTVVDTGKGIEAEHIGKIFDPFFTTKPKGEGTGMGLAVVHGIVTGLGGAITVDSAPGSGTRISVFFPALPGGTAKTDTAQKALPVGKERILFVDDEPFQTDMFKHMLGLLGYTVEVCNSGDEALSLFDESIHSFDLVITDMIMPGMTGDQLAQKMLALRPDLPIILATGYSDGFTETQAKKMGLRGYAVKPLVMEELAQLVRTVLDTAPDPA